MVVIGRHADLTAAFVLFLAALFPISALNSFKDESAKLLGNGIGGQPGIPAAFADVNADRQVDIILIRPTKRRVDAIVMSKETTGSLKTLAELPSSALTSNDHTILGVIPADFNGDSRLDLVILTGPKSGGKDVSVYVAYGLPERPKMRAPMRLPTSFLDQPALLDWNGDMIADLMGETAAGKCTVLLGGKGDNFTTVNVDTSPWNRPAFTAFVDVNDDNQPDIFLTTKSGGKVQFEVLLKNNENTYSSSKKLEIALPSSEVKVIGTPVFADFRLEGSIEMALPACKDAACSKSSLYIYSFKTKQWKTASIHFHVASEEWGFIPSEKNPLSKYVPSPFTLRVGDVNGDGYPDMMTVLQRLQGPSGSTKVGDRRVGFLLGSGSDSWSLHFPIDTTNATLVAPFDFQEQGRLGFIEVVSDKPRLRAFMQGNTEDAYFIKVMVLNGLCSSSSDCPDGKLPYGLPVPGPVYKYDTERPEGGRQVSKACQVSKSSYLSLELPFHIFGLGPFANYIESLLVTVPNQVGSTVKREKYFTFIVPKTQLVVIPYPLDDPAKSSFFRMGDEGPRWKSKLFLEPFKDKKVLFVAVALLGTMFVVAITIGILQWRERREDLQEKLQEAQKFHFDAM